MKPALGILILPGLLSCAAGGINERHGGDLIGLDSFALAARYGTPATYQYQGDYLQLNYGSAAVGCQLVVLVDQQQRVAGWASSGSMCEKRVR
ncbi:hypothetical protein [Janthinobacterium sp. AD80]|uniref:hypothetical protein n=1 Tax=Janthinobacterium sp. AD80 TaxID=1528773 RepID=UPI000C84A1F1|nr:hypothetical protein [Janthinobacterium sp. AD80]PMQ16927.1 hypothetical protein JaAD80_07950 [Janthinobacterium sp. AD80]